MSKVKRTEPSCDIDNAMEQVRARLGLGVVMRLGDQPITDVKKIDSGIVGLNMILGGGWPMGRITELYGGEGGGKSTIALHAIASAQAAGHKCLFIDAEYSFSPSYAQHIGVDVENLYIAQPASGEAAFEIIEAFMGVPSVGLIVLDSVAAMPSQAEVDGDVGDSFVGTQARMLSSGLRKIGAGVSKGQVALLFINQLREKIGVMYGNPETTPGGRALKFWSSIRLEVRKKEQLKSGTQVIGHKLMAKAVKNKIAPPFREVELEMIFGAGINICADLLDSALAKGVASRSGSHYRLNDQPIGVGKDTAVATIAAMSADDLEGLRASVQSR